VAPPAHRTRALTPGGATPIVTTVMTTVTRHRAPRNRTLPRAHLRERVFGAALELFRVRGYDSTTVAEIAKRAKVAKGTVFNFFPSKSAILLAHYETLDLQFGRALESLSTKEPRAALVRFFRGVEKLVRGEGILADAIVRETAIDATLRRADETSGARDRARWSEYFRACQGEGTVDPGVDPAIAGDMVADLWSSTVQHWVRSGKEFSLEDRLAAKLDVLFAGLDSKGGRRRGR
jgi:TetR/AcrR family transcriptional regulator, cholesterol catabolism regulator